VRRGRFRWRGWRLAAAGARRIRRARTHRAIAAPYRFRHKVAVSGQPLRHRPDGSAPAAHSPTRSLCHSHRMRRPAAPVPGDHDAATQTERPSEECLKAAGARAEETVDEGGAIVVSAVILDRRRAIVVDIRAGSDRWLVVDAGLVAADPMQSARVARPIGRQSGQHEAENPARIKMMPRVDRFGQRGNCGEDEPARPRRPRAGRCPCRCASRALRARLPAGLARRGQAAHRWAVRCPVRLLARW
jgi:hypothetical protein